MRNNKVQTLLIILVLALGLGYAYINSDLNINGTAQVNSANWDVHWANIQVTNGSVTGTNVVTEPTISNQTTVNYSIILNTPGDFYEFTVDAVNGGSIDAMIDSIDSKLNGATVTTLPAYLNYTVTYADGVELEPNHELLQNTTETYKVRIEYSTDINVNQIPASNQSLSLQFTVIYRQANENVQQVNHRVTYTANIYDENVTGKNFVRIGQAIPDGITQYNSASEAIAALRAATNDNNIQFCLKHIIENGVVTESYVEFVVSSAMASANPGMTAGTYVIRGFDSFYENNVCKEEYYNSTTDNCISPYYESSVVTLLSAFGSSHCEDSYSYFCSVSGLGFYSYEFGYVRAYVDEWSCSAIGNGSSVCGIIGTY